MSRRFPARMVQSGNPDDLLKRARTNRSLISARADREGSEIKTGTWREMRLVGNMIRIKKPGHAWRAKIRGANRGACASRWTTHVRFDTFGSEP